MDKVTAVVKSRPTKISTTLSPEQSDIYVEKHDGTHKKLTYFCSIPAHLMMLLDKYGSSLVVVAEGIN